jgi:hypothetical protein
MTTQQIYYQAIDTLQNIIGMYIKEFGLNQDKPRQRKILESLLDASSCDEPSYETVNSTVIKTANVMKGIEYESTGDIIELKDWRMAILQIASINHIARSHPDSAKSRLKKLNLNPIKEKRVTSGAEIQGMV